MISRRTTARCSRPDNLTFSIPRPARLTHPDCEYLPPVGCRREPPRPRNLTFFVFTCLTQRVSNSRRTPARCSRPDNLTFSSLLLCEAYPSNTASIELSSDVGESLPARQTYFFDPAAFTLLSKPVRLGEPRSPDRRRREHSRPDNLAFSSPTLGEDYPSDTESLDLPSDVGESLPARQTHLFRPLVPQYRTPIEFYIPDWSSNLSFQSTTGEA